MGAVLAFCWRLLQTAIFAAHPVFEEGVVSKKDSSNGQQRDLLAKLARVWNPIRRVLQPLAWPLVVFRGAGLGLRAAAPNISRSLKVWRHILPIFSMYMWTNWSTRLCQHVLNYDQEKVEARWAKRHKWGGKQVFDMIVKVQGYYVKTGQILASKREFIPAAWAEQLGCLWDATPPTRSSWKDVAKALERSLRNSPAAIRLVTDQSKGPKGSKAKAPGFQTQVIEAVPVKKSKKEQRENKQRKEEREKAKAEGRADAGEHAPNSPAGDNSSAQPAPASGAASEAGTAPDDDNDRSLTRKLSQRFLSWSGRGGSKHSTTENSGWFNWTSNWLWSYLGKSNGNNSSVSSEQQKRQLQALLRLQEHTDEEEKGGKTPTTTRTLSYCPTHVAHVFARVDATPLASASIAQVHTAGLNPDMVSLLGEGWSHGAEVVVKIQHQHVRRLINTDLHNMERIAKFLTPVLPFDLLPIVHEMQKVVPLECDFEREERMMSAIRSRLIASGNKGICVPQAVPELCGPSVIVMQRMRGRSLTSLLTRTASGDQSARSAGTSCLLPVLQAYGQMMLVDGMFHADPHPGNMLLQEDGRVSLLDWGQVKALTSEERVKLCELYRSLNKKDVRAALSAAEFFGLKIGSDSEEFKHMSLATKAQQAMKMLTILFDTRYVAEGSRYSFGGGALVEGAPLQQFPADLYLICRAVFILRGLCNVLGMMDISIVDLWAGYAATGLAMPPHESEARAQENAMLARATGS